VTLCRNHDKKLTDKPQLSRIFLAAKPHFSAGLNPAKPDFSGWLRLSKIAAG